VKLILKSSKKTALPFLKGDIILIASLCLIIVLLFVPSFTGSDEKLTAEIYHEGELVEAVSLSETDKEEITVGSCVLLLEKDGVSFVSSDCHDKLCVKRGKLKRKGDTMACVPERVVAVIKGEKPDDFHISTY
jgi:hypothetical protein